MTIEHIEDEPSDAVLNQQAYQWFSVLGDPAIRPETRYVHRQHVAAYLGVERASIARSSDLDATMGELTLLRTIDLSGDEPTNLEDGQPINADQLQALRTGRSIARRTLADAYKEQDEYQSAGRDPMTGMVTKGARNSYLYRVLAEGRHERQATRQGNAYVGFADATNFKRINDMLGHGIGDECIKEAARILEDQVRPTDIPLFVHPSGDEFDVVLGSISADNLEAAEERIFASQAEKITSGRYGAIWRSIEAFKDIAQDPTDFNPTVRLEEDDEGQFIRTLFINGERVAPLSDMVVVALGFDRTPISAVHEFEERTTMAEAQMHGRKSKLHELMGGADR